MVHCVQTLPSDGSKVICSKPFRCCFIFCLFLLHLGQSVEKLKGEESMKVSFGFTEAGADYFTRKSLFHLFIYFYLKRNWDSLQHFRIATPAYFIPQCGFSTSEQIRFFSLLQWTASKRDTATPHVDLRVFQKQLCCASGTTKAIRKAKVWVQTEIQGQTPFSHSAEVIPLLS